MEAKVRSAAVFDRDGIKLLLERINERAPRLSHPWMDAGYNGRGKGADWAKGQLGWTAQIVRRPPRAVPEEVVRAWARE